MTTSASSRNDRQPANDNTSNDDTSPLNNRSFLGYVATQFLGAFNDNLFKQLILLLAIPVAVVSDAAQTADAAATAGEGGGPDLQGLATVLFGLPFVIFGGLAGYLADRFSKRRVIVLSKFGEIAVMLLGLAAFLLAPQIGFSGLWVVLFLMGTQSAFFGPAKYGILPEMLPAGQLARANGVVLMTTFIAIIFGTACAGPLKDFSAPTSADPNAAAAQLWIASIVCILVAAIGTAVSLWIRPVPIAEPNLAFKSEYLAIPRPMRQLLSRDRALVGALGASCIFWMIAGLTLQAVNSLCKVQLGLSDSRTSWYVALISIGIALGGVTAGQISRRPGSNRMVLPIGMWGVVLCCLLLSITRSEGGLLVGDYGLPLMLVALGAAAAFFSLPIQVFLQARPPAELKGRMIAVMNQANFFAIVLSGVLYMALDRLAISMEWPRSTLFAAMAVLFLPVALFYRLDDSPLSTSDADSP